MNWRPRCLRNQFKAHPVNERVLLRANTGVPKVVSKETTRCDPFDLAPHHRRQDAAAAENEHGFHAKPVPKGLLAGITVRARTDSRCQRTQGSYRALKTSNVLEFYFQDSRFESA